MMLCFTIITGEFCDVESPGLTLFLFRSVVNLPENSTLHFAYLESELAYTNVYIDLLFLARMK